MKTLPEEKLSNFYEEFIKNLIYAVIFLFLLVILNLLNFLPYKYLVELGYSVNSLMNQRNDFPRGAPRLVLIDIDELCLKVHVENHVVGEPTPRWLLATILDRLRSSGPAVVILDFDFRTPNSKDDAQLMSALRNSNYPVIIPRSYYAENLLPCEQVEKDKSTFPVEVPNVLDSMIDSKKIFEADFSTEEMFGVAGGFCSYRMLRGSNSDVRKVPAIAFQAMALASHSGDTLSEVLSIPPDIERFDFRINPNFIAWPSFAAPQYSKFQVKNIISLTPEPLINNAIVVVGASHSGSRDVHSTPFGPMSGAFVLANAILQLQVGRIISPSIWVGFGFDIVFLLVNALLLAGLQVAEKPIKKILFHHFRLTNIPATVFAFVSTRIVFVWIIYLFYMKIYYQVLSLSGFSIFPTLFFSLTDIMNEIQSKISSTTCSFMRVKLVQYNGSIIQLTSSTIMRVGRWISERFLC